jgi:hypothetical protein
LKESHLKSEADTRSSIQILKERSMLLEMK